MSISLADLTTLRSGGPIADLVETETEADLITALVDADQRDVPLLVLGGGSNLLAGDGPFDGTVIRDRRTQIRIDSVDGCGGTNIRVSAGTPWEDVVEAAVTQGWMGIECLTGIPGCAGATPVQNVGAYGQEVADVISTVRCWDRQQQQVRTFARAELDFSYRNSLLKQSFGPRWPYTPRYVVLDVGFQLPLATRSAPIRYAELAHAVDVPLGSRADAKQVRAAVRELRRGKGMLLDAADHDTWSAGSFFTNPIVSPQWLPHGAPSFEIPRDPDRVKTSAAWLISHAGFRKGYGLGTAAGLSTKHVLAVTNRGGATSAELIELARTVRDGVRDTTGITLVPEPVLIGASLD